MEYNFNKVQDADFCCKFCFLNNVMSEFEQLESDDYASVVVIANEDLAHDLFRELSEVRCECGDRIFGYGFVNFDNYEYEGEYIISISSDFTLSIEPMVTDTGDYLYSEGEIIFIHEDCDYKVIERLNDGENKIVIFSFDDEE